MKFNLPLEDQNKKDVLICLVAKGNFFDSSTIYRKEWHRPFSPSWAFDLNWNSIGVAPCNHKIQNFLGACILNDISTKYSFYNRRITYNPNFPFCHTIAKTREHVFRDCHRAIRC